MPASPPSQVSTTRAATGWEPSLCISRRWIWRIGLPVCGECARRVRASVRFSRLWRFLASLVEQEGEGLLGSNLAGDAAEGSVLLQPGPHHSHRLAALPRVPVHFAVYFVLGRSYGLAIGDLIEDQRRPHIPLRAALLGVANLLPVQLE